MVLATFRLHAPCVRNFFQRLAKCPILKNVDVDSPSVHIQRKVRFGSYSRGCFHACQLSKQLGTQDKPYHKLLPYRKYTDSCIEQFSDDEKAKSFVFDIRNKISSSKETVIQMFNDFIKKKGSEEWTAVDWQEIELQASSISRAPWEATCMQELYNTDNLYVAHSLKCYLESKSVGPINRFTLVHYFAVLAKESNGSKEFEAETIRLCNEFMSELDILDTPTAKILLKGMSWSKDLFKEGLKVLESQFNEDEKSNNSMIVDMILACLRHKDLVTLEKLINNTGGHIEGDAISFYIPEIVEVALKADDHVGLMKVFELFEKQRCTYHKQHLDQVVEVIKRYEPNHLWTVSEGYVNFNTGCCNCCGQYMGRVNLSDEDFVKLRENFIDQVIIGKNILYKSTPRELEQFLRFLAGSPKFDVVIDGLNLLYRFKRKEVDQVMNAIKYFVRGNKQILVLGVHASNLLHHVKRKCENMHPKPVFFFTQTSHSDDVFYLLAAMLSGKDTLILSRDKLRDHKHLLSPTLRTTFTSWLRINQAHSFWYTKEKVFILGRRDIFSIGPAQDAGGYHFPVFDFDHITPNGKMSILCLRNGKEQSEGNGRYNKPSADTRTVHREVADKFNKQKKDCNHLVDDIYALEDQRKQNIEQIINRLFSGDKSFNNKKKKFLRRNIWHR